MSHPISHSLSAISDRCLGKWPRIDTPLRHVIWAEVLNDVFEVSLLARKRTGKGSLSLVRITGKIDDEKKEEATRFTQAVMEAAYGGWFFHSCLVPEITPPK